MCHREIMGLCLDNHMENMGVCLYILLLDVYLELILRKRHIEPKSFLTQAVFEPPFAEKVRIPCRIYLH